MPHPDAPPLPENEAQRLQALRRYDILDTPPEQAFDDLSMLARLVCDTPTALINLIDDERQWTKSAVGAEVPELPRSLSLCAHAILQPDALMEVPDALADPRFAHNPMVTREGGLRFYAGVPLVTADGHALGSLCVTDVHPRRLDAPQREALRALGRQVVTQLELRRLARWFQTQSTVDELTQVWNRRAFDQRLADEWARHSRRTEPLGLLMIDVDHFKRYNDELGHPAGDRVLSEVASVVGDALRGTDHLSRYGGEEFVAILPTTGVNGAMPVAQRVRQAVERHAWQPRGVTVSVGLASLVPGKDVPAQHLLERADHALLLAKRRGRNRVEAFAGWQPL